MADSITILVVGDEDIFIKFLGQFSPKRYVVQYANDTAKAKVRFLAKQPKLIVLCVDEISNDLSALLAGAREKQVAILGIHRGASAGDLADHADRVVPAAELGKALVAANEMLQERRRHPRVLVELPIALGDTGPATATVVSQRSLFVATENPLKAGSTVTVVIEADGEDLSCEATVGRLGQGASGHQGMVLEICGDAPEVSNYLEGLVHWINLLEHYQRTSGQGTSLLPEPISRMLAQRALQLLLSSEQLPETVLQQHAPPGLVERLKRQPAGDGPGSESFKHLAAQVTDQRRQIASLKEQLEELSQTMAWSPDLPEEEDDRGSQPTSAPAGTDLASLQRRVEELQGGLTRQTDELRKTERELRQALEQKATISEQIRDQVVQALHDQELRLSEVRKQLDGLRSGPMEIVASLERDLRASGAGEPAPRRRGELFSPEDEPTRPHDPEGLADAADEQGMFDEDVPTMRMDPDAAIVPPMLQKPAGRRPEAGDGGPDADLSWEQADPSEVQTVNHSYDIEDETGKISNEDLSELTKDLDAPTKVEGPGQEVIASEEAAAAPTDRRPAALDATTEQPLFVPPDHDDTFKEAPEPQEAEMLLSDLPKPPLPTALLVTGAVGIVLVIAAGIFFLVSGIGEEPSETSLVPDASALVQPVKPAVPEPTPEPQLKPQLKSEQADAGTATADKGDAGAPADTAPPNPDLLEPREPDAGQQVLSPRERRRRLLAERQMRLKQLLTRANRMIRKKQYVPARKQLTEALKINDNYRVRELLGRSHDNVGELWAAVYHYEKAAASAPGRLKPRLYDRVGLIFARLKKTPKACRAFKQALSHKADFKPAVAHNAQFCK